MYLDKRRGGTFVEAILEEYSLEDVCRRAHFLNHRESPRGVALDKPLCPVQPELPH